MQANHISPFLIRPASGRGSAFPDVPPAVLSFPFLLPIQKCLELRPEGRHPGVAVAVIAGGQLRIFLQVGQLRLQGADQKGPALGLQPVQKGHLSPIPVRPGQKGVPELGIVPEEHPVSSLGFGSHSGIDPARRVRTTTTFP